MKYIMLREISHIGDLGMHWKCGRRFGGHIFGVLWEVVISGKVAILLKCRECGTLSVPVNFANESTANQPRDSQALYRFLHSKTCLLITLQCSRALKCVLVTLSV